MIRPQILVALKPSIFSWSLNQKYCLGKGITGRSASYYIVQETYKYVHIQKQVCAKEQCRHFQRNKTARQVWTPQSKAEGVPRVLVFFEKNDGTPATIAPAPLPPPAQLNAPAAGPLATAPSVTPRSGTPTPPPATGPSAPAAKPPVALSAGRLSS
ncbi:unnamed protein product [Toxocara canis]|uniref:Protein kinase domain-containing protein n=1 Tax=Toxocara canis TaxID=6265 RepID=A0A183U8F7_TOXCA|nr:unnamed protein product [Toxocara canis]